MKHISPRSHGFLLAALLVSNGGRLWAQSPTIVLAPPPQAGVSPMQQAALSQIETNLLSLVQAVTSMRTRLITAAFTDRPEASRITGATEDLKAAELALALARAEAFSKVQATTNQLLPNQVATMIQQASRGARGAATPISEPINFDDHTGFVSLFDGTLTNWDGNPMVWHVVDGTISADSTVTPGNTFVIWKGEKVQDFELKLKAKLNGGAGSGIMYRSRQQPGPRGDPWYLAGYQYNLGGANTGQLLDQAGRALITPSGEIAQLLDGGRDRKSVV